MSPKDVWREFFRQASDLCFRVSLALEDASGYVAWMESWCVEQMDRYDSTPEWVNR